MANTSNESYFILTWYRIVTAVISITPGAVVFTTFQRTFTFRILVAVTFSFLTLPSYITAAFFIAIFLPVAVRSWTARCCKHDEVKNWQLFSNKIVIVTLPMTLNIFLHGLLGGGDLLPPPHPPCTVLITALMRQATKRSFLIFPLNEA